MRNSIIVGLNLATLFYDVRNIAVSIGESSTSAWVRSYLWSQNQISTEVGAKFDTGLLI